MTYRIIEKTDKCIIQKEIIEFISFPGGSLGLPQLSSIKKWINVDEYESLTLAKKALRKLRLEEGIIHDE